MANVLHLSIDDGIYLVRVCDRIYADCNMQIDTETKYTDHEKLVRRIQEIADIPHDDRKIFVEAIAAWSTDDEWHHVALVLGEVSKMIPAVSRMSSVASVLRADADWRRDVMKNTIADTQSELGIHVSAQHRTASSN